MSRQSKRARTAPVHFDEIQSRSSPQRPRKVNGRRRTCTVKATPDATTCGNPAVPGGDTCSWHSPCKLGGNAATSFPDTPTPEDFARIAQLWGDNFKDARWTQKTCSVCAGMHNADEIVNVDLRTLPRDWLRPLRVPVDFLPHLRQTDPEHYAALFTYRDALLDGHILEPDGFVFSEEAGEYTAIQTCRTCFASLGRRSVPRVSLANGMWTGPLPPELAALTPAEEIVIGLARSSHTALFFLRPPGDFTDSGGLNTRQRASRGHWLSWPQFTDRAFEAVHAVPLPPDKLADVLHVTLIGPGVHEPTVLHKALEVSITRLRIAYDWLVRHNHLYAGIAWDNQAAARYSITGGIPDELEQFTWTDEHGDLDEREGYSGDADSTQADPLSNTPRPDDGEDVLMADAEFDPSPPSPHFDHFRAFHSPRPSPEEGTPPTSPAAGPSSKDSDADDLLERFLAAMDEEEQREAAGDGATGLEQLAQLVEEALSADEGGDSEDEEEVADSVAHDEEDAGWQPGDYDVELDEEPGAGEAPTRSARLGDVAEIVKSGFAEADGRLASMRHARAEAIDRVTQNREHIDIPRTNTFESSYDYDLLPRVFPKLFPYGVGGFAGSRETCVPTSATGKAPQLLHHIRGLLVSHDRRFAEHENFMFFSFDLHQRREVARQTAVKVNQSDKRASEISQITLEDLVALRAAVFSGGWVMGSLVGSEHSRLYSRNHIRALVTAFGIPGVWFTVSPADQHSVLLLKLNRFNVDLDADGVRVQQELPDLAARRRAIANDPVAVAIFFRAVMDGVLEILFGARRNGGTRGVFGSALAHYATIESGKRGYLHAHGMLWLHGQPSPAELQRRLADPKFEASIIEYHYPKEIVADTHVSEAGEVIPRRRHDRVNGHNPLLVNLTRCNSDTELTFLDPSMPLSFILYATKYMTKSDLAVKRTLALLELAYQTFERYDGDTSDKADRARILLRRCCSRIGADVELPAPAVAYYLLFGEDHFASDKFVPLQLTMALVRLRRAESARDGGAGDEDDHAGSEEEQAALQVDAESGEVIEYNQVEDYVCRHPELEGVSFYLFCARFEVKKKSKIKKSATASRQFYFTDAHPRHKTHAAHERETAAVPVLQGPTVPRRGHTSAAVRTKYARSVLTLFRPWRALGDLVEDGETWEAALANFEPDADVAPYIENLQLLHAMKEEGDKRRAQHEALGEKRGVAQDGRGRQGSLEPEHSAANAEDADPEVVVSALLAEAHRRDPWMFGALDALRQQGLVPPTLAPESVAPIDPGVCIPGVETYVHQHAVEKEEWREVLSAQDNVITARRRAYRPGPAVPISAPAMSGEISSQIEESRAAEIPAHLETVDLSPPAPTDDAFLASHETNPVRFARGAGLNKKQTEAFCLVALAQLDAERGVVSETGHIFVAGAAGSGKSVVLATIANWMALRRRTGQLRLVASTGTAAAKIKGMTLHSLLGYRRGKKSGGDGEADALTTQDAKFRVDKRVRDELEHVTLVCCDEVGMVGHCLMNGAHEVFQTAKGTPSAFGNIVTVWFGDHCQFAPVGDAALYDKPGATKARVDVDLWSTHVRKCIILDQPMRQRPEEVAFLSTLGNLHLGRNTATSWLLLNNRVAGLHERAIRLADERYKNALFITARHGLRREVNRARTIGLAREKNQLVFASVSRYKTAGRQGKKVDFALLGCVAPRHHGNCDPVVFLTVGMPVVVNANMHTGQGVTNGAYGIVTKIVLDGEDAARLSEALPGVVFRLLHPPPLVIVKMRHVHDDLVHLDGLEPGEVPITPVAGRTELTGDSQNFKFEQLPISGAFAVTDYRAQGATEDAVVIDLVPPGQRSKAERNASPLKNARAAAYVAISRVTTLDGLAVLRSFDEADLGRGVEQSLEKQLAREKCAEAVTRQELSARVQALGWMDTLRSYIVNEKKYDSVF
ncbi:hypothetical protein JCM10213_002746 [Rhodosporidiobolus nylandii]